MYAMHACVRRGANVIALGLGLAGADWMLPVVRRLIYFNHLGFWILIKTDYARVVNYLSTGSAASLSAAALSQLLCVCTRLSVCAYQFWVYMYMGITRIYRVHICTHATHTILIALADCDLV